MNPITEMYVKFQLFIDSLKRDEKGQGLVEYALILVLVAIAAMVAMRYLATSTSTTLSKAGTCVLQ